MSSIHPRPNPIIAAMYTLRDMDVDVIVIHGPAGCGFMASRMLEQAGVRVVTSGMTEKDIIFGGEGPLLRTLGSLKEKFNPRTVAVIGTCTSMIIGDDVGTIIRKANLDFNAFFVNCHGCMESNTEGAIRAIEAGMEAGILSEQEAERQAFLLKSATSMEKAVGMASKDYLQPAMGPTKLNACNRILKTLSSGGKVAVVMLAKKELAYRFSDMFVAVEETKRACGGSTFYIGNLDNEKGLPRIRRYANDILQELESKNIRMDKVIGGLDEYAVIGEQAKEAVESMSPDLLVIVGIPHAYPGLSKEQILITDQPRQLANYLSMGLNAVGEISSHSMVMYTRSIIPLETGETLRELAGLR